MRLADKVIESEAASMPSFDAWALAGEAGTAVLESPFDHVRRILSFQRVVDFPLTAIAGIAEDQALATFHRRRTLYLTAAGVASAVGVALTTLLMLQGLRLRASRRHDREGAERLRLITDNMPALISYLDADHRVRFANRAYRDWLGVDPQSLIGRSLLEIYGAAAYAEIKPRVEAALAGERVDYEREFQAVDGRRDASVSAIPHRDGRGKVVGLYVMTTDITVQKAMLETATRQHEAMVVAQRRGVEQELALQRAQQSRAVAEQANLAKSAFLATMSHEIRTPMNGVVGMVDVLAQSPLSADQADIVATVRTSALSLLGCIDAILDFSKIEAGAVDLERCVVALPVLVRSVCASLAAAASADGVGLEVAIDPRTPEHVWGDPTRLRQVLVNLVGNAIKFSAGKPGGRGRVSLRVDVVGEPPLQLSFVIADNGIGIAADALDRLFMPFVQAESTTTRRFGGTGLGLVISKRLVELMHGRIEVSSEPGSGSAFTVTLPFDGADAALAGPLPDAERVDPAARQAATEVVVAGARAGVILVAEDDEVSRKVIRRQLDLLGYDADVAGDGAQALRLWREGTYAMLITDLHMPEMDGYALAEAIRREELAEGRVGRGRTPILALTANAQQSESARIHLAGMDAHLTKPIQLAALKTALAHWFERPTRAAADEEVTLH